MLNLNNLKRKVQELIAREKWKYRTYWRMVKETWSRSKRKWRASRDFQNRINELKEGENEKRKAGKNQIEEERLQRRPDEEKGLETMKTDPRQTFQLKIERNSG